MKKIKQAKIYAIKNTVAKFAFKFNKSLIFKDQTKYQRQRKHKGKEPFSRDSLPFKIPTFSI